MSEMGVVDMPYPPIQEYQTDYYACVVLRHIHARWTFCYDVRMVLLLLLLLWLLCLGPSPCLYAKMMMVEKNDWC